MPFIFDEVASSLEPESLVARLRPLEGIVLLRTALFDTPTARYSFVSAEPFLRFRSFGARCETSSGGQTTVQFGNPWHLLDALMARFEILDELDLPFPLGGCFGFWGFGLKGFVEPRLPRRALNDLELPDCDVGFYDSLVVFDHYLGKRWVISTGLGTDGARCGRRASDRAKFWTSKLADETHVSTDQNDRCAPRISRSHDPIGSPIRSTVSRAGFLKAVERAQNYIRSGDIYQVNLSHRLTVRTRSTGWHIYKQLLSVSPAPFSAYYDSGPFQIASSSPELFLRITGAHIQTRPIKGTRPRSADPDCDARLNYELLTSPKELAELVMITDLLRNDLGKICEYGSIRVPQLVTLERYPQVQHLVSTIEGRLRTDTTHFKAFASSFPGGSVTGAPKIRALEIIDELESVARGPYTGALGYLGFNRESQLSILIRTAVCHGSAVHFNVGAGIVADSDPAAEYAETMAKAGGFIGALHLRNHPEPSALK